MWSTFLEKKEGEGLGGNSEGLAAERRTRTLRRRLEEGIKSNFDFVQSIPHLAYKHSTIPVPYYLTLLSHFNTIQKTTRVFYDMHCHCYTVYSFAVAFPLNVASIVLFVIL